jgi:predicted ester cyclase
MFKRLTVIILTVVLTVAAFQVIQPTKADDDPAARNKANIIKMYDETNAGDTEFLRDLLAPDFISYGGAGFEDLEGPDAFMDLYATFIEAFPDLHFEVTHVIAEDDLVAVRGIQTGTQEGNFMGMIPPTNKEVSWTGTAIFRFNDEGKIIERWQDLDQLGLFMQLGVIPPFGSPGG